MIKVLKVTVTCILKLPSKAVRKNLTDNISHEIFLLTVWTFSALCSVLLPECIFNNKIHLELALQNAVER